MKVKTKEYFKTSLLWIIGILVFALFTALIAMPFVLWIAKPYRQLDIWVVDKTVPYSDFREHAGLFWLLNNEKIAKPATRVLYDKRSDYYGFYPTGKNEWRSLKLPQTGKKPDLIYIADTYGVYRDDYMQSKMTAALPSLIYGGLNSEDYRVIQASLGGGNTIIAEFNTAASPTNSRDRALFERLIGLAWRGWIGNYYESLAQGGGVPDWVVANWETAKKEKWNYSGRGIVLLDENGNVEVLTEAEDLGPKGMKVQFDGLLGQKLGIKKPVSYRYWFEWVAADPLVEQVAHYSLDLTAAGKKKLEALGLPQKFPAVLKFENSQYTSWYFAGDFADLQFSGTPYRMEGIRAIKRILADDTVDNNSYFFWKVYAPLMHYILAGAEKHRAETQSEAALAGLTAPRVDVRAVKDGIQLRTKNHEWETLFLRGVNMGLAEPGKYFTEFPYDTDTYVRWFNYIGALGANTIRVYTLLPPEFYRAFRIYNEAHPDAPLLLLQEIWPEEHPPGNDYLQPAYQEAFLKEIDYGIDAIYGRANIPERKGRAWGIYTTDVSPWLIGWLVGRELESAEVLQTDANHKGATYKGTYVSAGAKASPTEVWLAESLDAVAATEAERYGQLHPVGIVSWPTLDPIEHDTEWDPNTGKKNRWNDRASIAVEHLDITDKMTAGLFGAYHIYPNYPDFIVNEPAYNNYKDEYGVLRYGGYLQEFIKTHSRYPAIVAEFGIANGAGVAHLSPDGLNHGGIDETTAGRDILRMQAAIQKEGYAGAIIFEFMDEWAKKTWITEPFKIPFDRRIFWHDVVDPEQNYGLIANESIPPEKPEQTISGSNALSSLEVAHDASYLYLTIHLASGKKPQDCKVLLGIDTYNRTLGQMSWPRSLGRTASGMEFLLDIRNEEARILVNPSYNIASARYATSLRQDGVFENMNMLVNGKVVTKDGREIPEKRFDISLMRQGPFDESGNLWNVEGNTINVRIPWGRLNVTDPSSLRVLNDTRTNLGDPGIDTLKASITDGFVFDGLVLDKHSGSVIGRLNANVTSPYIWNGWEETPPYRERPKKSYSIVQDAWKVASEKDKPVRADFVGAHSK